MSTKPENYFGNGGNLKQGGMHHSLREDGRSWLAEFENWKTGIYENSSCYVLEKLVK